MRHIIYFASVGLIAMAAATPVLAESSSDKLKMNDNGAVTNQPGGKTSDRTPESSSPDRGAGAGTSGAAGTGAAKTPSGTSNRTPDSGPDSGKGKSMD